VSLTIEKLRFRIYLSIFLTAVLVGIVGFMYAEGLSLGDAAYFTIVTIATVGYGDIAPHTSLGKAIDVFLIIAGVGTFVGVIANATESFVVGHDRRRQQQKLHMVIGLYFSELGTDLLRLCAQADPHRSELQRRLKVDQDWTPAVFGQTLKELASQHFTVAGERIDLETLRSLLEQRGQLLVRLLESPYLLEHERFTDLLIATLHLKEELLLRPAFVALPETDRQHLAGDVNRVYDQLARQWLDYLAHLKEHYPFLFSLAIRTNPFNPEASAVVKH